MIHTFQAYGFKLGGPGSWVLKGMQPESRLVTPWYDEVSEIAKGLHHELTLRQRNAYEIRTPFLFETAVEISPPGWTREASAPPTLAPAGRRGGAL